MRSLDAAQKFHADFYDSGVWNGPMHWMGVPVCKPATDLWAVQQIIVERRPDVIVECGTWMAGSALFYACIMDMAGIDGEVVTIDIPDSMCWNQDYGYADKRPEHPKLVYVCGSSTEAEMPDRCTRPTHSAMVILDSDHHMEHVEAELNLWAPYVPVGQYLIVEDTRVDQPSWMGRYAMDYDGPGEAIRSWGAYAHGFVVDHHVQPALTFHPGGYLRRVRGYNE